MTKILSFSHWVDGTTGYFEITSEGSLGSITANLIERGSDGRTERSTGMTSLGNGVYSYPLDKSFEYLEGFQLFSGGSMIAEIKPPEDLASLPGDESNEKAEIPTGKIEERQITNNFYRLWGEFPWTPFQRKISVSNGSPATMTAGAFFVDVSDDKLFINCFNPQPATREHIDSMLDSPAELFQQGSGTAVLVEDTVVVPLSDGVRAWTEEYPLSDFMQVTTLQNLYGGIRSTGLTRYGELVEVGHIPVSVSGGYSRGYGENTEVPVSSWRSEIGTLDSKFNYAGFSVPVSYFHVGNAQGDGLVSKHTWGTIANDNYHTWRASGFVPNENWR